MKVKVSEATNLQLDWMVANPGKVSRYMSVMERIHRQSSPRPTHRPDGRHDRDGLG